MTDQPSASSTPSGSTPHLVLIAGPNGAGKTTAANKLLVGPLAVETFVNADLIAQELAPGDPERVAVAAGRLTLAKLDALAAARANFAFETTLSGLAYAPWLRRQRAAGYAIHLIFLWLPSSDMAVERVARRVASGGHHIPEPIIRRRYAAGIRNFFAIYSGLADRWAVYDSSIAWPHRIADGAGTDVLTVLDRERWRRLRQQREEL